MAKRLFLLSLTFLFFSSYNSFAQTAFRWADILLGYSTTIQPSPNVVNSISVNSKGQVYVLGNYLRGIDLNPGTAQDSVYSADGGTAFSGYLAKYDSSGVYLRGRALGMGNATATAIDDSNNLYIGGATNGVDSFGFGYSLDTTSKPGFYIAKYDSTDHLQWVKVTGSSVGGDLVYSLKTDHAGNVYAVGEFTGTVDFDLAHPGTVMLSASVLDGFVSKYDRNGNLVWVRQVKGTSADRVRGLAIDGSGNVIISGYTAGAAITSSTFTDTGSVLRTLGTNGGNDGFVAKYNNNGALMWLKALGGPANDYAVDVVADAAGSVYVSGRFRDTMTVDSARQMGVNVSATNDAGYLLKLGAAGNVIWVKNYGCDTGAGYFGSTLGLAKDAACNVYVTGTFNGSIILDPAAGRVAQYSSKLLGQDSYIMKLDSAGHFKWSKRFTNKTDMQNAVVALDKWNSVFTAGYISDTTDFNPGGSGGRIVFPRPSPSVATVSFVCKYGQFSTAGITDVVGKDFKVYPNPVSDQLVLSGDIVNGASILVMDILGKAYQLPMDAQEGKLAIGTKGLAPGMYILQYYEQGGVPFRAKFIKE